MVTNIKLNHPFRTLPINHSETQIILTLPSIIKTESQEDTKGSFLIEVYMDPTIPTASDPKIKPLKLLKSINPNYQPQLPRTTTSGSTIKLSNLLIYHLPPKARVMEIRTSTISIPSG